MSALEEGWQTHIFFQVCALLISSHIAKDIRRHGVSKRKQNANLCREFCCFCHSLSGFAVKTYENRSPLGRVQGFRLPSWGGGQSMKNIMK